MIFKSKSTFLTNALDCNVRHSLQTVPYFHPLILLNNDPLTTRHFHMQLILNLFLDLNSNKT